MRPRNPLEVRDREALRRCIDTSTRVTTHSTRSLGEVTGVSHATIGDLLTGRKTRVTISLAQRLSAALGVRMEDLFMPAASELADADEAEPEEVPPSE